MFHKVGPYVVGTPESAWFVVVEYLPVLPGQGVPAGTPDTPQKVYTYTHQQVELEGFGKYADSGKGLVVAKGLDATETPEVTRTGDFLVFPTPGTYKVSGTVAPFPSWIVQSTPTPT